MHYRISHQSGMPASACALFSYHFLYLSDMLRESCLPAGHTHLMPFHATAEFLLELRELLNHKVHQLRSQKGSL